jgi:rod shape-determining protein MreD
LIAWGVGFLYALTKGTLGSALGSDLMDLDLVTVLTAYLFLFHGIGSAAVFAFGQGLAIDLLSTGTHGLNALLCLCVLAGLMPGAWYINLQHRRGQVFLVALVALLKKILFFGILKAAYPGSAEPDGPVLWISGLSVLATALITAPVFYLLARAGGGSAEEEETETVGE